jgi:hypothetical protein
VEADNCWKKGIKVYGVQCGGDNSTYAKFYQAIAGRTCGTYVKLDDFNVVKGNPLCLVFINKLCVDMILAVCFREVSAERVAEYEREVIAEGRMTEPMNRMFRQVSGEVVPEMSKKRSKTLSK